ncbi:MAG: restriction endonuclease subunit S [Proteobacteria bacterium]|nr:restriction endonuclease subunit S [Pseudomonadota bacterium]
MWHNLPLGNLAEITSGGTPSRDVAEYWGGDIPWVTPTDITACRTNYLFDTADRITKKGLLNSPAKVLPVGTILFTSRATVGISKIAGVPVCTNQGFKCLSPLHNVDGKFLFYQVQRIKCAFERFAAGSTFLEINKKDTARVLIPHPVDPNAQKKIAAILTSIDTAIEKTEALIEKYQQIKAGLMQDLFTRGVLPNGQLRPPREQAPELYQQTAIGWIPKEWETIPLEASGVAIIDGDRGENYPQGHELLNDGFCLFLSATNVTRDGFKFESTQFISAAKHALLGTGSLQRGDIVITTRGTVGNIAYFDNVVPFEAVRINSGMVILRSTQEGLNTSFLYSALKNYVFIREYMRVVSGSAQPQLPIKDFKRFNILIPSLSEQELIVERANSADDILRQERKKAEKLRSQKLGLMQDLLTGKVPVKVDIPVADSVNA